MDGTGRCPYQWAPSEIRRLEIVSPKGSSRILPKYLDMLLFQRKYRALDVNYYGEL